MQRRSELFDLGRRARILLALLLGAGATACVEEPRSDETVEPTLTGGFHVPESISPEAQEIVRSFARPEAGLPAPDDLDGWRTVWEENEAAQQVGAAEVVARYEPTLEEVDLGGVPVLDIKPRDWVDNGKVLIYIHGGAYTLFSAGSTLSSSVPVAAVTGLRVISVDYTTAPFAKFDQTTDQVIAVIRALVENGYALEDLAIYGDSAGGGLAAGSVLKMRNQGLGMPAAVVLWSPWADITETGDSYSTLRDHDPVLVYTGVLDVSADAYADPADQQNPYVSPVYADYSLGYPPTMIQGGTKEIFLSNFVRLYQAMDNAGQPVTLDLYDGMWHVFQAFHWALPESDRAREKMAAFLREHLAG